MRVRKVVERPWPAKREAEPWAPGYALPWGEWLREWPDFCWVMPFPRPTNMRLADPMALFFGVDVPIW